MRFSMKQHNQYHTWQQTDLLKLLVRLVRVARRYYAPHQLKDAVATESRYRKYGNLFA